MKKTKTTCEYPVTGIIIANEWDMNGRVIDVVFCADNEEVYWINKKEPVQDLLSALQKRVRIIGEIFKLSDGRKAIDIKSFKIINSIDGRFNKIYI